MVFFYVQKNILLTDDRKLGSLEVNQFIHQLNKIIDSFNAQNSASIDRGEIPNAGDVISQFMHDPRKLHMDVVQRIFEIFEVHS